jgi:hypothetical protein
MNTDQILPKLIQGSIDLHIHSAPDIIPRKFDDFELAKDSLASGLSAIVIKNHMGDTAGRAALVNNHVHDIEVYGGVVLNYSVGGLNPYAVDVSLRLGGKIVWMPTLDSAHHRFRTGKIGGISIIDEKGFLRPEVMDILILIKEHDAAISTGHLSLPEIRALISAARDAKIHAILVAHPEFWITYLTLEEQRQLLLGMDNLFFERCFYASTLSDTEKTLFSKSINWIKNLGFESTIISSDLGQVNNPKPAAGIKMMIEDLLQADINPSDIRTILQRNPRHVIC